MNKYEVVRSEKSENHLISHTIKTGKGTTKILYTSVRIGISWPADGNAPSYFTVVGQQFDKIDGPLGFVQISEFESATLGPESFYEKLTDAMSVYCANAAFTDLGSNKNFVEGFSEFASRRGIRTGYVAEAPYNENLAFSLGVAQDYWKRGMLDLLLNGTARNQIKALTRDDLDKKMIEGRYYGVNGLRYVLSAFHKYPSAGPYIHYSGQKSSLGHQEISSNDAWMVV